MKKQLIALASALTISTVAFAGASSASAKTVTINSGDTLSGLAATHGRTVDSLKQMNGLSSDLIIAGALLEVGNGSTQAAYQAPVQQQPTYQAPAQQQKPVTYKAPVKQQTTYKAPVQQKQQAAPAKKASYNGSSSSAKSWIANKESGNSYGARSATGKYVGKYQLTNSYLKGDYSAANQERVADNYVKQRYGTWDKAKAFHQANGWY